MDANHVSILADATSAYEPEIGVKKFTRQFEFTAPGSFTITDHVETNTPKIVTAYLHADHDIKKLSKCKFDIEPNGTSIVAEIIEPKKFKTEITKNVLTAPGDPGFVDKGGLEERGKKLGISTKKKVSKAKFVVKLSIKKEE